jgi:hypothetical protein
MIKKLLTSVYVKKALFLIRLDYAGKTWRDNRKKHLVAYGLAGYIVQATEILALLCLFAAIELLVILWWSLL